MLLSWLRFCLCSDLSLVYFPICKPFLRSAFDYIRFIPFRFFLSICEVLFIVYVCSKPVFFLFLISLFSRFSVMDYPCFMLTVVLWPTLWTLMMICGLTLIKKTLSIGSYGHMLQTQCSLRKFCCFKCCWICDHVYGDIGPGPGLTWSMTSWVFLGLLACFPSNILCSNMLMGLNNIH